MSRCQDEKMPKRWDSSVDSEEVQYDAVRIGCCRGKGDSRVRSI